MLNLDSKIESTAQHGEVPHEIHKDHAILYYMLTLDKGNVQYAVICLACLTFRTRGLVLLSKSLFAFSHF